MVSYRNKIRFLLDCDIDPEFFRLLLKQERMSERTKRYIDKLWEVVKDGYEN